MAKHYKSPNAKKVHQQQAGKPPKRDSPKFKGGSNKHHGASISQSGQPRRGR